MNPEHQHQLTSATESLRTWLAPIQFHKVARSVVTSLISDRVVEWAQVRGFRTRREVLAVPTKRRMYGRNGYLDVTCIHNSGQRIAVEIDFSNKVWSIEKLAAEADRGRLAIWVKWGTPTWLSLIPEKIGVIELRVDSAIDAGHTVYSRTAYAIHEAASQIGH